MQRFAMNSIQGFGLKVRTGQMAVLVAYGALVLAAPLAAQAQTQPPAAAAPAAAAETPFQIPAGWRRKTVKGEEVFCKKTAVTGSRFGKEVCMTLAQLEQHERNNAEMRERMQQSFRLCSGGSPCAAN